jgi:hypothetical protein
MIETNKSAAGARLDLFKSSAETLGCQNVIEVLDDGTVQTRRGSWVTSAVLLPKLLVLHARASDGTDYEAKAVAAVEAIFDFLQVAVPQFADELSPLSLMLESHRIAYKRCAEMAVVTSGRRWVQADTLRQQCLQRAEAMGEHLDGNPSQPQQFS